MSFPEHKPLSVPPSIPAGPSKKEEERFGRYLLLEQIGRGGMAEIFRAVATGVEGFQRVFVLKRILKDKCESKEFIDMFVSEARISAMLNHPNIVQIYDFGQIRGSYFLTMEYLRGKDLLSIMRQLRATGKMISPGVAAFIAHQTLCGLHYAHSLTRVGGQTLSIVHRDVSPSNIMLMRAGGVKLLDFGIAKAATEAKNDQGSQAGLIKGKLSYLSPEQIRCGELDGRSDVFSLGVVLWEMLTGRRLFYDKNDVQTMKNVMERPVPPPSTIRPDLPTELDFIVVRALERDLDRRYPSAKVMADELSTYLEESRYSQGALAKLLDELFGEDSGQFEAQVPEAVDLTPVPLPAPDELGGANLSATVPPMAGDRRPSARPRARMAWIAAGLAAAGGIAFATVPRKSGSPASTAAAVSATATATGTATPPSSAQGSGDPLRGSADPLVPAPAPVALVEMTSPTRTVSVRVDSDPPGAEIRGTSGELLGKTPATLTLPRASRPYVLVMTKPGFSETRQVITPDRDVSAVMTLKPAIPSRVVSVGPARPPRPARVVRPSASGAPAAASDGKVREAISVDPFADAVKAPTGGTP